MTSTHPHLPATTSAAAKGLPADADVPVSRGMQRQGDVLVLPLQDGTERLATPQEAAAIPAEGVMVVRGEAGGNGHLLVGDGSWSPSETGQDLGVVHVAGETIPHCLLRWSFSRSFHRPQLNLTRPD
jgi:hypothetical protein